MSDEELNAINTRFEREFKQWCIALPIYFVVTFGALMWMLSKVPS